MENYYTSHIKKWEGRKLLFFYSSLFIISFFLFAVTFISNWQKNSLSELTSKVSNEAKLISAHLQSDRKKLVENHLNSISLIITKIIQAEYKFHVGAEKDNKAHELFTYYMFDKSIFAVQVISSDKKKIFASWREGDLVKTADEISVKIDLTKYSEVCIKNKSADKPNFLTYIYYNPKIINSDSKCFSEYVVSKIDEYGVLVNSWLTSSSRFFLLTMVLTLIIAQLLLLILTKKLFIDPLQSLSKTAEEIRNGNFDSKASENEVIELSVLAKCLNSMSSGFADTLEGLKTAKQLAIKNEKYITTILDSVKEAVISLDSELKIQKLNHSAESLLGLSADLDNGKNINDVIKAFPSDGTWRLNNLVTLHDLSETANHSRRKIQIERLGRKIHLMYRVSPIVNEERLLLGAVVVMHDETESFLQSKYLKEAQKMETVGLLAGGVAHDFNNILQVIMTSCSILMKKASENDDCQIMLSSISEATRKGKELVGQLLVFSRRKKATLKLCNLTDVVEGIMKMIKRIIGEDIEVNLTIANENCGVNIDSGQIEQVLMNLCMNAKDALPHGGKINIDISELTLTEASNGYITKIPEGKYALITVKDNGSGIPPKILKNIFTPFFTTKEVGKGTGLGLATVYGVVEEHGGYVDVTSEVGQGTEFLIYLPLAETEIESNEIIDEKNESEIILNSDLGGTIMIAEDDPIVRMLTATSLRDFGFNVIENDNGVSAVNSFSENSATISLVILDVIMPKMSGFGAFEIIREIKNDVPVIFASGYAEDRLKLNEKNVDNVEFLQKPYEVSELCAVINKLLAKEPESDA